MTRDSRIDTIAAIDLASAMILATLIGSLGVKRHPIPQRSLEDHLRTFRPQNRSLTLLTVVAFPQVNHPLSGLRQYSLLVPAATAAAT